MSETCPKCGMATLRPSLVLLHERVHQSTGEPFGLSHLPYVTFDSVADMMDEYAGLRLAAELTRLRAELSQVRGEAERLREADRAHYDLWMTIDRLCDDTSFKSRLNQLRAIKDALSIPVKPEVEHQLNAVLEREGRLTEENTLLREVASWAQAVLTAWNANNIQCNSPLHLKLREVMITYREKMAALTPPASSGKPAGDEGPRA